MSRKRRLRLLSVPLLAGGALAVLAWWQPRFALRLLATANPDVLFFVDTVEPVVALTIDDGPHPTLTPQILDILAEHQAHATFFLIGERVPGNAAIVRRLVAEGHERGNHHMAETPSIRLSPAEFERQLLRTHELLAPFGSVRWFRPGSGWFNRRMLRQLAEHGYTCVLGAAYPEAQIPSAWYLSHHILLNTRPGSIIILHDGTTGRKTTVAVLRRVLPELRRRGYRVATVSELMVGRQGARR